jgi:hypothetical protein
MSRADEENGRHSILSKNRDGDFGIVPEAIVEREQHLHSIQCVSPFATLTGRDDIEVLREELDLALEVGSRERPIPGRSRRAMVQKNHGPVRAQRSD